MPTYRVTDSETGQVLRLTGDSPPTEQELETIFSTYRSQKPTSSALLEEDSTIGPRRPFSFENILPSATEAVKDAGSLESLTFPGGPPARVATRGAMDILRLFGMPLEMAMSQARRTSQGRPMLPAKEALRTELSGGEMVQGEEGKPSKLEPAARLLAQGLVFSRPVAPAAKSVAQGVAKAVETAQIPRIPNPVGSTQQFGKDIQLGRVSTLEKPNRAREALVGRVRNRLLNAPKLSSQEFGSGLDDLAAAHPEHRTNLVDLGYSAKTFESAKPSFRSFVKRFATTGEERALIDTFFDAPDAFGTATLQEVQKLKSIFGKSLKTKFQQIDPDFYENHLNALELWHGLRAKQLETSPQMRPLLAGYRKAMENFRIMKSNLTPKTFETGLLSNFGGRSEVLKAFKELATPETLKMAVRLQKATGMRQFLKRFGLGVATTAVGGGIAGAAFRATAGQGRQ